MLVNLMKTGVKRLVGPPQADILTVKKYHPEVLRYYEEIVQHYWNQAARITSGYRDKVVRGGAKNSPHFWGIALDVSVGHVLRQIEFAKIALEHGFTRAGLYPRKGIVHIDIADRAWIKKYKGAQYWVSLDGEYWGFRKFERACKEALTLSTLGGD